MTKKAIEIKRNDIDFDASTYEPATLTPAPKKAKTRKRMTKKAIEIDSDDDIFDEIDEASNDDDDFVVKPRARPTGGRKTIKQNHDSDEGDKSDSDDEFEFDE